MNKEMNLDANLLIGEYQKELSKLQSEVLVLRTIVAQYKKEEAEAEGSAE